MTLLVVRLLVLLISSSTSLGSTVLLNSLVVEENLCFPLVYLYSSVCLESVALTPPPIVCCPCKVLSTSSPLNYQSEGNSKARDGRL